MEVYKVLDPLDYGLAKRTKIVEISNNHIAILKQRKSRIIMKDGLQIMEIVNKIRSVNTKLNISLIISGPLCSKTRKYLSDNDVAIMQTDLSL